MVLNPEPNLRPLSICREGNPLSDHRTANYPPKAGHTSSSSIRTPASETFPHSITRYPDGDTTHPNCEGYCVNWDGPRNREGYPTKKTFFQVKYEYKQHVFHLRNRDGTINPSSLTTNLDNAAKS